MVIQKIKNYAFPVCRSIVCQYFSYYKLSYYIHRIQLAQNVLNALCNNNLKHIIVYLSEF